MPLAARPQDLALMLVPGSRAIWLGSVDRTGRAEKRGLLPPAQLSLQPPWTLGEPIGLLAPRRHANRFQSLLLGSRRPPPPQWACGVFLWTQLNKIKPNPSPGPNSHT